MAVHSIKLEGQTTTNSQIVFFHSFSFLIKKQNIKKQKGSKENIIPPELRTAGASDSAHRLLLLYIRLLPLGN
jgi:hypothetical protein